MYIYTQAINMREREKEKKKKKKETRGMDWKSIQRDGPPRDQRSKDDQCRGVPSNRGAPGAGRGRAAPVVCTNARASRRHPFQGHHYPHPSTHQPHQAPCGAFL